jgi:hypothetical protein
MKVPENFISPVVKWAIENKNSFEPNGYKRCFGYLEKLNAPQECGEIKKLIIKHFLFSGLLKDNFLPDFCGFIEDGGKIHRHNDICPIKGKEFVRVNVMLSKPDVGGDPIINGKILVVNEGDAWLCQASKYQHECNKVQGRKPRIVLSYGFIK